MSTEARGDKIYALTIRRVKPVRDVEIGGLLTMFQTVDPERRIFRSSGNISAERRNEADEIRDDWLIFIAADETESGDNGGPPVKAVALTIPLSHLVRMVFEHVAQNDKEQKERESRERKRKRGNRRRRRGW